MQLTLVAAAESDRSFFIDLHNTAYRATVEKMFPWDSAEQHRLASAKFDLPGLHIAWLEGEPIGSIGWVEEDDHFLVREVFVTPSMQNQGVGTRMIRDIQKRAHMAIKKIQLRTLRSNLRAKALYERLGFVVADQTDLHWYLAWDPC